jgi:paraquat-inducible protein B
VSGLSTLISGVYIELAPGASSLEYRSYTALSDRPATPEGTPGLYLTLNCDENFAYAKGDPIIYNGLIVGQFESVRFDLTERVVYYSVFIEAPYHELVTENTKFWDATGLRISVGAAGLSVQTGNLATLLTNGLTFGVPAGMPYGAAVAGGSDFDIYPDYEAASEERYQHSVQYVVLVSDTVRGLAVGAPVEYRGILVGKVLSRSIAEEGPEEIYNDGVKIPVLISMQPARVGLTDDELGVRRMNDQMLLWIDKGLKASLKTGSLLTGSLYVDLQHYDELPVSLIAEENGYTVIPTIQDGFSQITAKASQFMDNLNAVDLAQLSENSNGLLKEFRGTAADLRTVAQGLQGLLEHVEDEALVVQVRDTLASLAATSAGFSKGSRNYEQLHDTLAALAATMNELNPLLRRLKSQPNGLIFDSGSDSSLEPKKFTGNNE